MSGPRILMPSAVDPVTGRFGAATSTRNLIRLLEAPPLSAKVQCLPCPAPSSRFHHRWRQARAVARSLAGSSLPAQPAFTHGRGFGRAVARRAADCDLAILNGGDVLWLTGEIPARTPRLLLAHNIEHRVFAEQAAKVGRRWPILRPLLGREADRFARWEIEGMRAVGRAVFWSPEEMALARGEGWIADGIVVPPVFFDPPFARRPRPDGDLIEAGFLANLHWWPNAEGLRWFRERVLPHLGGRVRLHVFGPGSERIAGPGIAGHGRLEDLRQVWSTCDLMIAPLLHGGGVSVKVAEALYHGMPLLTTRCAMRGLEIAEDPCVVQADDPEEWIEFLRSPRAAGWRGQRAAPGVSA